MYPLLFVYGGARWWALVRALLVLVVGVLATVGFVAATASLVAGFGVGKPRALEVATLFGGVLLLAVLFGLFARRKTDSGSRTLAVVGVAFAVVGLALFWTYFPPGWTGDLARLPPIAVGAYAVGLLAVVGAGVASESPAPDPTRLPGIRRGFDGVDGFDSVLATDQGREEDERSSDSDRRESNSSDTSE